MQTWLPYPDFTRSAAALDYRRLGAQRSEARRILKVLRNESPGWRNHPVTRAWAGYEEALQDYGNAVILEWMNRGYKNTMALLPVRGKPERPPWFGGPIHSMHRALLLHKAQESDQRIKDWYDPLGWTEKPEPLTMDGPRWFNSTEDILVWTSSS